MSIPGSFDELDAADLLRHLNETDEHSRCEAKTSQELGRSLMETICAFSNEPGLGGGYVLLGVARDAVALWPTFRFVGLSAPDQLQADIASKCRTDFSRPVRPRIKVQSVNGKTCLLVFVPELGHAEKPLYFSSEGLPKGAYRHIGSTDQRCSADDLLVFYGAQQTETFDRQVVQDATLRDIDPEVVAVYRHLRREIREPLVRAVQRARAAVMDDLPKAFGLPAGSVQRQDIPILPDRVIREVVVNALMHRCYRTNGPSCILRYSNRIEIRNPGHSLVSDDRLGQPGSETRNPAVAAVLYDIGFAETKGSGIRAMRNLMNEAGLPPPMFESDRGGNQFIANLLLHHFLSEQDLEWLSAFRDFDLARDEQLALIVAREMGAVDNATYRSITGVDTLTASGRLRRLRDHGLLEMKGKGAQTYYRPTALLSSPQIPSTPPQSGGFTGKSGGFLGKSGEAPTEDSQGPTSLTDFSDLPDELKERLPVLGGKAPRERVRQAILELCSWRPLMPAEIAHYLRRKSVKRLVEDYVSPMFDEQLLERTIPDNPAHPGQRYRTTGRGAGEII